MEEAWELAVVMLMMSISTSVIGRLDRPTHTVNFASSGRNGRMGHPIKSGDDGMGLEKHGNLPL